MASPDPLTKSLHCRAFFIEILMLFIFVLITFFIEMNRNNPNRLYIKTFPVDTKQYSKWARGG